MFKYIILIIIVGQIIQKKNFFTIGNEGHEQNEAIKKRFFVKQNLWMEKGRQK